MLSMDMHSGAFLHYGTSFFRAPGWKLGTGARGRAGAGLTVIGGASPATKPACSILLPEQKVLWLRVWRPNL